MSVGVRVRLLDAEGTVRGCVQPHPHTCVRACVRSCVRTQTHLRPDTCVCVCACGSVRACAAVIDALEENLQLSARHVEPSRATLRDYGNTSSSSIWYDSECCTTARHHVLCRVSTSVHAN